MKTLIRLLLLEQSDLGLHCLPRPCLSENLGSLRFTAAFLVTSAFKLKKKVVQFFMIFLPNCREYHEY